MNIYVFLDDTEGIKTSISRPSQCNVYTDSLSDIIEMAIHKQKRNLYTVIEAKNVAKVEEIFDEIVLLKRERKGGWLTGLLCLYFPLYLRTK